MHYPHLRWDRAGAPALRVVILAAFACLGFVGWSGAQPDPANGDGNLGFLERQVYRTNRPHRGAGFKGLEPIPEESGRAPATTRSP